MPTRRCCCGGTCTVYTDDFDRANAADLGTEWEQPDGSIGIESARAKVTTGPANAYTVFENVSEAMYVAIETFDEESGDIYEVWCNVVDEDNHHFVRFNRNSTSDSVLSIGVRIAGVETLYRSQVILSLTGTARTIHALISPNEFCGWIDFSVDSGISANSTIINDGKRGGFYANRHTVWFDNFVMEKHFVNNPDCRYCACKCDSSIMPPILNAFLYGTGPRMSALNCNILLYWNRIDKYWKGSGTCCGVNWILQLNCDPEELLIQNVSLVCTAANGGTAPRSPSTRVCDPLLLVYGPYNVPGGDLACPCGPIFTSGDFTIEITEAP